MFPADATDAEIKAWQDKTRTKLRESAPTGERGSLLSDAGRFLQTQRGRRLKDFSNLLGQWTALYGDVPRDRLTVAQVQAAFFQWEKAGVAPSTLNKRRQALLTLWKWCDGKKHNCPARDIAKWKEPKPEARALDPKFLVAILDKMPACATKARLMMVAFTGCRPSELMRVLPQHLNVEDGWVRYSTGKEGEDRVVPLSADALVAAKMFVEHKAFGEYSTASVRKSMILAAMKAKGLDPKDSGNIDALIQNVRPSGFAKFSIRPYDLRHTFATLVRQNGADLADVGALLGHKKSQTTQRYAPTVQAKLVAAVAAVPTVLP